MYERINAISTFDREQRRRAAAILRVIVGGRISDEVAVREVTGTSPDQLSPQVVVHDFELLLAGLT